MSSTINKNELISKLQTIEGLTNEERSNLIGLLRQHKKYGLVWEDKPEDVEERLREELPVLHEVNDYRDTERIKIECARRHFASISDSAVTYDVVKS